MSAPIVSLCVLVYGDYVELARRCIESIVRHCPREQYRLLVGMNAPGEATKRYVREMEEAGAIDAVIYSEENLNKCPMMRRLFEHVETEFIWWFDDDSWFAGPNDFSAWLGKAKAALPPTMMWGKIYFFSDEKEFSNGEGVSDWVRHASWYRGRRLPSRDGENGTSSELKPDPERGRWYFATGGSWLIRTKAVRILDWPDRRLVKAADDVLLGEAMRQRGWRVEDVGQTELVMNDHDRRGCEGVPVTRQWRVEKAERIEAAAPRREEAPVEAVIVNWRRPGNVRRIVEVFAQQSKDCTITLIEAAQGSEYQVGPETLALVDRHFVFSHNYGSFNRFVPILGYTSRYMLFHDDDLLPGRDAVKHLLACAAERPHFAVMGEFGRTITATGEELTWDMGRKRDALVPVDFLVRSYFLRTENLRHLFAVAAGLGRQRLGCEDDILMCTSIQQATGWPCLVTKDAGPEASLAREHLPEPFALWHRPEHFPRRKEFIRQRMAAGWRPLAGMAAAGAAADTEAATAAPGKEVAAAAITA